ncbi:uncharacterized protein METZ01_LOCUS126898 [marine metagenome]|uniref:Uncharacterized protein n=1 Tax=marine metagenome TaxID=408172 RepID=A0A381YAN1_9ZZZZ
MAVVIDGDGTVTGATLNWINLGTDSIEEDDIGTDAVTATELKDSAVVTSKLADSAVTGTKLGVGGSVVKGDVFYASGEGTLAKLPKGTTGQVLTMGVENIPEWSTPAVDIGQWSWVETYATTGNEVGKYIYMLQNNVELGYDYMLTWRDIRQGSDQHLKMCVMTGTTPTALTTSYTGTTHFAYNTTHTAIREITSYISLSHTNTFTGADAGDAHFGEFTFLEPARPYQKAMFGLSGQRNVNMGEVYTAHQHCWSTNVEPMTGIRIGDGSYDFRAPEENQGGTNSPKFIIYRRKIS